jgi:hypothetical protein
MNFNKTRIYYAHHSDIQGLASKYKKKNVKNKPGGGNI